MKVIQAHNRYRAYGGEDSAVEAITALLRERGIEVIPLSRDSREVGNGLKERLVVGAQSVYSRTAYADTLRLIRKVRPDVFHAHNVYPLLSPSVLRAAHDASVPVIMTLHNYRHICPIGVHFTDGAICERCQGGREYSCVLRNCRGNLAESALYALRTAVARRFRLFDANIDSFIAPSDFLKRKMVDAGYDAERFRVIPNFAPAPATRAHPVEGKYVAYIGRFSPEKGVESLLAASTMLPEIDFKLAGDYMAMPELRETASTNTVFVGQLDRASLDTFLCSARCIVVPSVCYEVNPMVVIEAMSYGLPTIAASIGGIPEVVEDGTTGLLFEPGNAAELREKIEYLWESPEVCQSLGEAAREKAAELYSKNAYYNQLTSLYQSLIDDFRDRGTQ